MVVPNWKNYYVFIYIGRLRINMNILFDSVCGRKINRNKEIRAIL